MPQKTAIIIGAGPAGLTAAYELLETDGIKPIILEKSKDIGGLSKTVNYKGNRMDIGGHRFFSKSERVNNWWLKQLPLEKNAGSNIDLSYQHKHFTLEHANLATGTNTENVMLVRNRLSRIYYLGKFFDYPLKLSFNTIAKLGIGKFFKIVSSYFYSSIKPLKPENSLEDFIKNRFGAELYETFFKEYTEKVWGVPCSSIPAEWGHQRIKGLSIKEVLKHAFKVQKNVQTSLIEKFLYPKYGPGQMWQTVAEKILEKGGEIYFNQEVTEVLTENNLLKSVSTASSVEKKTYLGDYFISTMPIKELVAAMPAGQVPATIASIAHGLLYRDFITIGVLVNKLKAGNIKDNWIYIQDKGVKLGRLQIFNNWSPGMVQDPQKTWIGLEYFCSINDSFWNLADNQIFSIAKKELQKIGLVAKNEITDHVVIRTEKAYPAYFGTYHKIDEVRNYLNGINNLFLIGRNGMHRYNNTDHSMLTAMEAAEQIQSGKINKAAIWEINTGEEYNG